jgi:hypothetical protein
MASSSSGARAWITIIDLLPTSLSKVQSVLCLATAKIECSQLQRFDRRPFAGRSAASLRFAAMEGGPHQPPFAAMVVVAAQAWAERAALPLISQAPHPHLVWRSCCKGLFGHRDRLSISHCIW